MRKQDTLSIVFFQQSSAANDILRSFTEIKKQFIVS